MASSSALTPERRVELNPFDVDAWNLLLREAQGKPIENARAFYERLVAQFPNAGRYWKAYIEHEMRSKNFENVEALFAKCLVPVLNIDLWKCYLHYIRETKGRLQSFRETMAKAYDFAIEKVGLDLNASSIYLDYIAFLRSVPAVGQYAENQRILAVRKVYQRAVVTPMLNLESMWLDYCAYEKSVNSQLAEKLISERTKDYQNARRVAKTLEGMTRGINRQAAVSVPPRGTSTEVKQVDLWKKYIEWEKNNPLETEDHVQLSKRVTYAYEQALLCLGYYPDIWFDAAAFLQGTMQRLMEKGDVNVAVTVKEIRSLYERAISGLMRESQLIYFAYADFEEERREFTNVKAIYDRLLEVESCDPTLAYIHLMKFVRRTEGIKEARLVFKRARTDNRVQFHVYVASALMEYYCSKEKDVSKRIFELGLRKYASEPEYAMAYLDFLNFMNEDNNTRVVFERLLKATDKPEEVPLEIWDRYVMFESMVGDLGSVLNITRKRREALKERYSEAQSLFLIDRYKFMNLTPFTVDQLKLMGYTRPTKATSNSTNSGTSTMLGVSSAVSAILGPGSTGTGALVNGTVRTSSALPQPSSNPGITGGVPLEMGGFPRPDTSQMIPFKPKLNSLRSFHPIKGGVFPPPFAVASLLQQLPPPPSFQGPFVNVDKLMDSFLSVRIDDEALKAVSKDLTDAMSMFGSSYWMDDVKRDLGQLVNTTADPSVFISTGGEQKSRKRRAGEDSDDESSKVKFVGGPSDTQSADIFKRRMNQQSRIS
uniref:Suf domain-containing protein n=1 Tax=Steinernema glaseri TaxID=37863 RepID=A0A1I8A424_9BILA